MSYKAKFQYAVPKINSLADVERVLKELNRQHEIEYKSIQNASIDSNQITVVSVPRGGGSSFVSSGRNALFVSTAVTAGTPTILFTDVGTSLYGVYGYVLKSNGDFGLAVPQVPPLTDTRTSNSVQVTIYDTGTLLLFIVLP